MQLSEVTKSIVTVVTVVVSVGTLILHETSNFLPASVATTISAVVGVGGIILHYLSPNTTTDPLVAETQSVRLKGAKARRSKPAKAA